MKCVDIETLLADYVDGSLAAAERAAVEEHLSECGSCREYLADIQAATAFMGNVPEVQTPPELIAKIIFETESGRHGRLRSEAGFLRWLRPIWEPVFQPRFAMGMALTILSFSMVAKISGLEVRQIKASDLQPERVWVEVENAGHRVWNNVVKRYDNLRLVLQVQNRLREWAEEEDEARKARAAQQQEQQQSNEGGK